MSRSLLDVYKEYIVDLDPLLREMGLVNGVHVDNEARLALLDEMNGKVNNLRDEAQQHVPDVLFPLKRFKRPPNTKRPIREVQVKSDKIKTCSRCGEQHVTQGTHTQRKGGKKGIPLNECYKAPIVMSEGFNTEYDVVLKFNPGSDDQLKEYAKLFHHKLGRNWKTEAETLDAKQVQKLINKYGDSHPIYRYALELRKIKKARGYAKGWVPDEKGLVYGQFKNTPETFRLAQSGHNFMNVSHRGNVPYAEELRKLLIAPPGYLLIEADSASVEAVFSGKFMGSQAYMDLATKGIHAAWLLENLGKEPTRENISWIKNSKEHKVLYDKKKRTVHGVTYGMGAKLLFESYPEYFLSKADAQKEIEDFYKFVPELQAWHKQIRDTAFKQGFLQSPWGIKNYYYQVYAYDFRKKVYKLGGDAKAVVAFQPQHANGMFQRKNLILIHEAVKKHGKAGKWFQTAIGHVHDSNGLRVPEGDALECATMVAEIMNRPIPEMGNIRVGVEVKAGKNWAEMKSILTI